MADQENLGPTDNNAKNDDNKQVSSAGNNTEGGSRPEPGRYRLPAVRRSQLLLPRIEISSDPPSSPNVPAAAPSTSTGNDAAQERRQHTSPQAAIPSSNALQVPGQQIGARRSQSPRPASQRTTDNNPPSRARKTTPYRPRVRSANISHPFPRTVTSYRTRYSVATFPRTQPPPQTETQPQSSRAGARTRTRTRSRPISRESPSRTRTRTIAAGPNTNTNASRGNENEDAADVPRKSPAQYHARLAREAHEADARADAAASSREAMARREEEARAARWRTRGSSGQGSGRAMRWGQEQGGGNGDGDGDGRRRLRKRFEEREHGRFGMGVRRVVAGMKEVGRKVREKGRRGMEKVDRGVRWWFGA